MMIVAASNSATAKKIKASLVVGRPAPGSGHVIVDGSGTDMPQRPNLQFAGKTVSVEDNPTLGRTVVEITASELTPATTTNLGGVIVGKNIEVDADGVISTLGGHVVQDGEGTALAQQPSIQFTGDFVKATDDPAAEKTVIDVTVPLATEEKPGIVQVGGGLDVDDSGVVSTTKGHEILDPDGNIMPQETQMQFTGDFVKVTDDPTTKRTTVDVTVPFATTDKPGIVQVGDGLSINDEGLLSSNAAEPAGSYFPANSSLRFWPWSVSVAVPTGAVLGYGPSRWYFTHLNSPGGRVVRTAISNDPNNFSVALNQRAGGLYDHPFAAIYPFTLEETAPLSGKQVTFSFDFSKERAQQTGETITFQVIGNTSGVHSKLDIFGNYPQTVTVGSGQIEDGGPDTSRRTFTFDVPKEITQICLKWLYTATPSSIGTGNVMILSRPRIDIGATAKDYETIDNATEYANIQKTQQVVVASFYGQVTEGASVPVGFYYQFPTAPNWTGLPTVLAAIDSFTSSPFKAASSADVTNISINGCKIVRVANVATGAGTVAGAYETTYFLSIPFFQ